MKGDPSSGEGWQIAGAYLLMIHGAAAMATLMLIGALVPLHIQGGWRRRRNRITGVIMSACNALLVVSALGLYYAASDVVRPLMSGIHIGVGLCLPVLF